MKGTENKYVKRTQKDYSMTFKMSVVREVEETGIGVCAIARKYGIQSKTTVTTWLRKFGNFDHQNKVSTPMEKTKDQRLLELEQKIKVLEQQNNRLRHELEMRDHKVAFFDMMIDMAEKEFRIDIRKNSCAGQSNDTKR